MQYQPQIPADGFLRLPQVLSVIPISKSAWWAGVKAGKYPPSVKLGKRTTCWRSRDILNLVEELSSGLESN